MKHFLMMMAVVFLSFTMSVEQAEAKRLGSGSNTGKQRDVATQQQAHQQPAMSNTTAAAAAPQQKSGMSKWLGPLAGLALGAGLFALLSSMGLDGALGGILLALLVGGIIGFIIYKLRKKAAAMQPAQQFAPAGAAPQNSQSSMWNSMQPQQQPAQQPAQQSSLWNSVQPAQQTTPAQPAAGSGLWGSMASSTPAPAAKMPADFPVEAFLRAAKSVFTRLQAANDRKDLKDLREFTTPSMFAEISAQLQDRGNTIQKTDVLNLNASVIEVVTEGNLAIASVRFSGQIRENNGFAENFDEIWHVQQDLSDKNAAWLLAGIQQTVVH